ncbi:iron complex transport system substrate-binding protein [Paenibacillus endophyticus]|uniref:Iron complex transport system substrate-binding protein n=1 Tax=Paenibacillus endophyticus TaxID=1294268 RepID=A0A7W5C827_9BACL|nr:ABC transporter substrate-binding protein [Paenibacillus endophyticus]MBB3152445.1 iron complex transport system substrate-binding protein [Paenibacillus endophyticus]
MKKGLLICCAAFVLSLTACSTQAGGIEQSVNQQQSLIQIKDFANRNIAFDEVPQHIVALSNGETDIIYALGGTLVGRPTSTTPLASKEAEAVEQIGSAHEVDLEKITLLRADVVLGNNPMNTKDVPILEGVGSKVILTSANSIDEIKKQIELFGQLLQKEQRADELIKQIDEKIKQYEASSDTPKPRALLVYGAPGTFMAALPNSLSGNILELAGGTNIASDYPGLQSYPQYAQLNSERIVEAGPQLILIMTHGDPEEVKKSFLKEMQTNPAWSSLEAVKQNKVEVLPSDLFGSNPGTRVMESLELLHGKLEALQQ